MFFVVFLFGKKLMALKITRFNAWICCFCCKVSFIRIYVFHIYSLFKLGIINKPNFFWKEVNEFESCRPWLVDLVSVLDELDKLPIINLKFVGKIFDLSVNWVNCVYVLFTFGFG